MMGNGFGYLSVNPLFGVGPYQWRMLNMADGDTYFNTWHIHNSLLHISVELGLIAALMLLVIVVRFFLKRRNPEQRGGFIAFFVHNMFDTSFFFPAITGLMMMTAAPRERRGRACAAHRSRFLPESLPWGLPSLPSATRWESREVEPWETM